MILDSPNVLLEYSIVPLKTHCVLKARFHYVCRRMSTEEGWTRTYADVRLREEFITLIYIKLVTQ
jgi:hypothetical protein